ncbi:MAG: hypothetical protein M3P84_07505, partial [Chloroflexota bacterium]|nr:hypothetical protein [Chloroflexota bacterium]
RAATAGPGSAREAVYHSPSRDDPTILAAAPDDLAAGSPRVDAPFSGSYPDPGKTPGRDARN